MRLPSRLARLPLRTDYRLPALLPVCGDLQSARNELRWIIERVQRVHPDTNFVLRKKLLDHYIRRRASGEPLQYILGSAYFGNLEIQCAHDVLIPRPDTAAWTSYLARLLSRGTAHTKSVDQLRVLDICTGSGCIPLLFHHDFYKNKKDHHTKLELVGVDLSGIALRLAMRNRDIQLKSQLHSSSLSFQALEAMDFLGADVMEDDGFCPSVLEALSWRSSQTTSPKCDVLMSNPPYISAEAFETTTEPSVRLFEPRMALVPKPAHLISSPHDGDIFYPRIVALADQLEAKVMLLEVADIEQASRVAAIVSKSHWDGIEIWRDEPATAALTTVTIDPSTVRVRGDGHGRSVFAYRGAATTWLGGQLL
ncbi:hypothetical protein LTR10_000855 [Elasticomyces elasticus]|nr:hypothetical protein LTR10_000855 [Elasticomyces elasticus]KAK4979900.1 hypothetical protein LTR42_000207 [Elasticomyces elasticus]